MTGFGSPWILVFLVTIPLFFYIYRNIIEKKKNEAIKFSNIKDWFFFFALIVFLVQLYKRYGGGRIIQ
jgi:hypothetical protein